MLTNFITFVALLAIPTLTTAQNASTPLNTPLNFNCTSLRPINPDTNPLTLNYTTFANTTLRVSKATTCPPGAASNDERCFLSPRGHLSVNATTNLTTIPDATLLASTVRSFLTSLGATDAELQRIDLSVRNTDFNTTGPRTKLDAGTSAYLAFRPRMTCFDGIFTSPSTCSDLDASARTVAEQFEGQAVRICIPDVVPARTRKPRRSAYLSGLVEVVSVSEDVVGREDMRINPADPEYKENANNGTISTGRPYGNGAVVERGLGFLGMSGWSGLVVWFGMMGI
ncbi:hypothetical protein FB567DRAFT_106287 [Paraphoma chrysanthemicola]|uniref:Uncharacterized protein n=1 Tax=Paraphoma chrysanthemicola TaxID=798071 RepID=A0A8K0VW59_9PLEO|nr:hypothetical protein FB567DRAFT_106287 [Paraphoma chrysanthemicola]